jgi:hypothetical protein
MDTRLRVKPGSAGTTGGLMAIIPSIMTFAPDLSRTDPPAGAASSTRRRSRPGATARLRAAFKVALAQAGAFERSIQVSIITDPKLEKRIPTLLNTGSEIQFNRRFLVEVADGSRRLHDILVIELGRAATIALGKRSRGAAPTDSDVEVGALQPG